MLTFRPDAQLHVVLGDNGAGKTQALRAVGDLLFGFGNSTEFELRHKLDFIHKNETLRIGARLRRADGSLLSFRRRKGNKNTIVDDADKPLSDDLLAPLLGGVTRETFFTEFGLTSRALREGGDELLEAGGRLAETLAASSARLSALSRLRAMLESEADALFGARRSAGKAFYVAADRHDEAEKRLRDAIVTADALKAAEEAVARARSKCKELDDAHTKMGRDISRRQRALRTRKNLLQLDALRQELETHHDLPMIAADRVAAWRAALDEQSRIDCELAKLDAEDDEGNSTIAELAVDEALLAMGRSADDLRETLGAVAKAEDDLPRRREAQRIALDSLAEAARRLGLESHEALLARLPTDLALAEMRESITARRDAGRRLEEAQTALEAAREELRKLETEAPEGHAADPAPFSQRLEAFADISADADRLRRATSERDLETKRLAEEAERLDPFAGAPDDLARRSLPEPARLEGARIEFSAIEEEQKQIAAASETAKSTLAAIETEIARLSKAGAVATREDLGAERTRRDATYVALGASLDTDAKARRERFDQLGAANRSVDETTDLVLSDADRASRLETARERLQEGHQQCKDLAASRETVTARRRTLDAAWADTWARADVVPHTPVRMARWFENVENILNRRRALGDRQVEINALTQKLDACRAPLTHLVESLGVGADASLPIEALYKNARGGVERLQKSWTAARERVVLAKRAVEAETCARATCEKLQGAVERSRALWPSAAVAIGLVCEASIAQAEAALAVWQGVPIQKRDFEEAGHRIETMQGDIAAFETAVAALAAAAAPDLAQGPARAALDRISERLTQARSARDQRETLQRGAKKRAAARAPQMHKRLQTLRMLETMHETLGLARDSALLPAIERLERRNDLADRLAGVLRDLSHIGDGHDEEALRNEQSDLDFDILPSEIERLQIAHKQLVADIVEAATGLHEAGKARDALAAGRDAEGAARDKAEASFELVSIAERWLARSAAARLAARAIERHRAAVQDPLVARASTLFAVATAGAFKGLGADFDEADTPVLVGLRPDGASVPVTGMSTGARDQLYLSLRLALLELRTAEPLPFIADDLLASFDDTRVARALGLLAEFGQSRQAILFTHHRRVAEIAETKLATAVDVISL
jgi:uncharacterized protein YhaN